jgi:hypothetical protein
MLNIKSHTQLLAKNDAKAIKNEEKSSEAVKSRCTDLVFRRVKTEQQDIAFFLVAINGDVARTEKIQAYISERALKRR